MREPRKRKRKTLPWLLWVTPYRSLPRSHSRRKACEAALAACDRVGLGREAPANVICLVLQALRTGHPAFMIEAANLFHASLHSFNHQRPVRQRPRLARDD